MISVVLFILICISTLLVGCGKEKTQEKDAHLTVYLWESNLLKEIVPYIKEQMPDKEIEFIVGNNNIDLYNYLQEHGDLPDIITTRRFSAIDAGELQPYLLDFSAYDIVSQYYPYTVQYYSNTDGDIQWLPVCGIPETMIVNKTILEQYGIEIPKNYQQFATACRKLKENGRKPYVSELEMDWAAHSLLQGAAINQFSSLKGIDWRSKAESTANGNIPFDDEMWTQVFSEVHSFIRDTYLTKADLKSDLATAKEEFINGKAAMFRGTPAIMSELESKMDDELVRIPYFSQNSSESWIYTYPSFNVALNQKLEEDDQKLKDAMKILNCFISEKGQKLIADGSGMISYNANVESDLSGMVGVEEEIGKNAFYIRYASNNSFSASLKSIQGMISGKMDEKQAYEAFKKELNSKEKEEKSIIDFQEHYDLSVNEKGGRDAASAVLNTVRKETGADLAFSPYYYYASSIYQGKCTKTQVNMMIAHNEDVPLYLVNLSGKEIKEMIKEYLKGEETEFKITNKYELPILSGMKFIVKKEKNGFTVENVVLNDKPIDDKKEYKILLVGEEFSKLQISDKVRPLDLLLDQKWLEIIKKGKQPEKPEDYILIEE